jgi:hypothetical protein
MPNEHPIVACARGWLGTRFHHQGRLKRTSAHRGGVDCLGLLVGVAAELQLRGTQGVPLAQLDETDYSHHPDHRRLFALLARNLTHCAQALPGDVALFEIDGRAQHLGIITELGGECAIIHAYAPARAVVEHALDGFWRERLKAVFRT